MEFVSDEITLAIEQRNSAKSRALRLVSDLTTLLRVYDGSEKEWEIDEEALEKTLGELNKRVYGMIAQAETTNRLVEEDDILRLELTKPIARQW